MVFYSWLGLYIWIQGLGYTCSTSSLSWCSSIGRIQLLPDFFGLRQLLTSMTTSITELAALETDLRATMVLIRMMCYLDVPFSALVVTSRLLLFLHLHQLMTSIMDLLVCEFNWKNPTVAWFFWIEATVFHHWAGSTRDWLACHNNGVD